MQTPVGEQPESQQKSDKPQVAECVGLTASSITNGSALSDEVRGYHSDLDSKLRCLSGTPIVFLTVMIF